jgi:hypothetical protein
MKRTLLIAILMLGLLAVAPADSNKTDDQAAVMAACKATARANLKAMENEDLDAMVATIHPKSPVLAPTKAQVKILFEQYDLKYEVLAESAVGTDGEVAVIRQRQKTTAPGQKNFRDNVVDVLHAFRKDGNEWKLWNTMMLSIEYLDQ